MKAYGVGRRAAAHQHVCLQGWEDGNKPICGALTEPPELGTGGTGMAEVKSEVPTEGQNHCEMLWKMFGRDVGVNGENRKPVQRLKNGKGGGRDKFKNESSGL